MANPPFNVDEVLYERVKDDSRFNAYGITKGTKGKGKDAKETVSNANYLWISYFATALNENGRAALVMANSASDAGSNDLTIRQNMIKSGIIKQMVTLPSNMFTSVTLPATLWFFDKAKLENQKDEILFIDARNIFTQIDRAHRKFSEEQIKNLTLITRLYEGDKQAYIDLIKEYTFNLKHSENKEYWEEQINWINERFPNGEYRDVIGLCKVAKIGEVLDDEGNVKEIIEDSIADQDWSLNAGRYVGVVIEDDGMNEEEFKKHMKSLNKEFEKLSGEAKTLEEAIAKNLKELFGE
jgi:type I restriction enzyme M protein